MGNKTLLLQYAIRLLARQPYSIAQMRTKLETRNACTSEEVESVIQHLQSLKYLDDEVYARLYIDSQLRRKPQGTLSLRNGLTRKGIPKEIIAKALQNQSIDEYSAAEKALEKKLKTLQKFSLLQQKERLYRFLSSRGFANSTVIQVLSRLDVSR